MDAKHFDAWTRRRFGLAAGSAFAALVALRRTDDAAARKRRCKRLGRPCTFSGRRCCGNLGCDFNYFTETDPNDTFCCKADGASCTSHESCCSTNCDAGSCTSCLGRPCDDANPCCPKIPCEAGFCGGCVKFGAPCSDARPCCLDNDGPGGTVCTQGYCGGCILAQAEDTTPRCSTSGADCCDTNCEQGLCVSGQGGPCQRNLDCLTCLDSENDAEICEGACDLDTHTCA
jgi:hypothetical protein